MATRVFVAPDTTGLSLCADKIAKVIQAEAASRGVDIEIVLNGIRRLFWLEALIEVETAECRVGFGALSEADVSALFDEHFYEGRQTHPASLGLVEKIPYLKNQQRLTFVRSGITDPVSLADYKAHDGYRGLENALKLTGQQIVDEVKASGLRGRGGAAFPTGIKWQTVLDAPGEQKYIVCNADEGDSGTFADRLVMECDPFMLIEGMTIAGLAVDANQGYIYLRSEYPVAHDILNQAIATAYEQGYLGKNILGSDRPFDLEVRLGAGAYICGEETSLLDSLEGKRGLVRAK